jgi:Stress responsive A/B Barrel Domain
MFRRLRFAVGGLTAIVILIAVAADSSGGGKDNDKQEQQLRKQVAALQQNLKQANNQIDNLQRELRERELIIRKLRADDKKDKGPAELRKDLAEARRDLAAAQQRIKDKDEQITLLKKQAPKETAATAKLIEDLRKQARELEALRKTPYLHTVIVKMKRDATADQLQALLDDIPTMLGKIPTVKGLWYGKRAEEASPEFAVKDFEISLAILFDNYDGLTRYLDHPMHKAFLDKHVKNVEAPLVYDALRPMP